MGWDWGYLPGALTGIAAVLVALISGVKNRNDRKDGIRSAQREGQLTFDARYQNVLDQVEEHLLSPMRKDLSRLRGEIEELRKNLDAERVALREERAKREELQSRFDTLLKEREDDLRYIEQLLTEWPSPPDPPQRRGVVYP